MIITHRLRPDSWFTAFRAQLDLTDVKQGFSRLSSRRMIHKGLTLDTKSPSRRLTFSLLYPCLRPLPSLFGLACWIFFTPGHHEPPEIPAQRLRYTLDIKSASSITGHGDHLPCRCSYRHAYTRVVLTNIASRTIKYRHESVGKAQDEKGGDHNYRPTAR